MPASQHFDERHLRDVVLAQSDEIRADRRFSVFQTFTRPVVALTTVVAIVAIALGVKDYVEQQKANAVAGQDAPSVTHAKAVTRPKKATSARTERSRMSAAEETSAAAGETAEGKSLILSEESGDAGANRAIVMGYKPNTLTQAARREREAATDQDQGAPEERGTRVKPATCMPLPNGTQPGDIDAPYYFGWATEYCGSDLNHPSTPPKVPESPAPTR